MDELPIFSKHTPRILRQQLLNELITQYLTEKQNTTLEESDNTNLINKENLSSNENGLKTSSSDHQSSNPNHAQPTVETTASTTPPSSSSSSSSQYSCRPSIQRFHGALLFVDISGFTPLSLKLDVEALKNQINAYFTKILEIVEKWGGDVVKFAGDALYIIWPTDIHTVTQHQMNDKQKDHASVRSVAVGTSLTGNSRFASAARQALEKAVACGLEISVACGHYEVRLDDKSSMDTHQSSGILGKFLPNFTLSNFLAPSPKISPSGNESESVVYLDVHAGVSIGLMAGIDIGHNDRWEYFLIGEPVTRVAECEGEAEKGDVVICKKAHSLLHNRATNTDGQISNRKKDDEVVTIQSRRWGGSASVHLHGASDKAKRGDNNHNNAAHHDHSKLGCGCFVTKSGLFCVSKLDTQVPSSSRGKLKKSRSKSKLEGDFIQNELQGQIVKINEEISNDLEKVFSTTQNLFKRGFATAIQLAKQQSENLATVTSSSSKNKDIDLLFVQFYRKQLRSHFLTWMKTNLTDDIVRHVHEATRDDYGFSRINRVGIFHEFVRTAVLSFSFLALTNTIPTDESAATASSIGTTTDRLDEKAQLTITSAPHSRANSTSSLAELDSPADFRLKNKPDQKNSISKLSIKNLVSEAQSTAELRSVTVMFVKIDSFDLKLLVDSFRSKKKNQVNSICYESFNFLDRTDNEIAADMELLNKFQECMVVLCDAFKENGGQLRQFIVDDKGTVCIGTFGLRGAVSVDNAASSLTTAQRITSGLQSLGLTGSIGITSGKTYCGLVGSTYRHEYAVMGASTNLSARLMCKAPPHGVICDTETKNRDRSHVFEQLTEVVAKGYAQPVMTYKPIYEELSPRDLRGHSGKHQRSIDKNLARSRGSEHSLKPSLTAREKLTRLSESDFYVVNTLKGTPKNATRASFSTAGNGNDAFMKLFGRSYEIHVIFNTLFVPSDAFDNNADVFDFTHPARMAAVCGSSGSGKTALATAITRRLMSVSKQDPSYNIFIMQNRQSGVHSNVPLNAWRPFVLELLRHFYHVATGKADGSKARTSRSSRLSVKLEYIGGLDIALGILPDFKPMRSLLLNVLGLIVDQSDPNDNFMSNKDKLNRCMDFVVQLFCCGAAHIRKYIMMTIEGVHLLDKWSLVVLHKVWLNAPGVCFFVTYCTSDQHGMQSWSTDAYENAPPIRPSAGINHEFFKRYDDPERFQAIDLHPLGKRSIMILAREFFGIAINEDGDLEKIYTASGGHPLYAVELMKSLMTQTDIAPTAGSVVGSSMDSFSSQQTLHHHTSSATVHHRIEEIICFRLDKLDFAYQIVLKAAAVAVSHGHKFSKDLIHFILVDNDLFAGASPPITSRPDEEKKDLSHNEDDNHSIPGLMEVAKATSGLNGGTSSSAAAGHHLNVTDVLLELLQTGEFIRLPSYQEKNKKLITGSMVEQGEMEFQIPLEQATIYSMVIDDQKHFFHERVALYNHLQMLKNPSLDTLPARVDEGFHWERASLWSRALRSYMMCAQLERQQNNMAGWAEFVKLSYRMYKRMEQETSQLSPLEEWTEGTIEFILKVFFGSSVASTTSSSMKLAKTTSTDGDANSGSGSDKEKVVETMSEEEVYSLLKDDFLSVLEVFEADHDALPLVALLHVYLADLHMQNYEDMDLILFILGVAFKLFLCSIVGKDAILFYCNTVTSKQSSKRPVITMGGSSGVAPPTMSAESILTVENSESPLTHSSPTSVTKVKMLEPLGRDYSFRKSLLTERDCLHLLSTFSIAYHFSSAVSIDFQEMISRITDRCVTLTKSLNGRGNSSSSDNNSSSCCVEYIQSLSLQVLQYMNIGQWDDAMTTCQQLITCYQPNIHAKQLYDLYGNDIVLYLLSSISQRMLLIGSWSKAESYYTKVISLLTDSIEFHQPSSILLALIPLLSTLTAGHSTVSMAIKLWESLGLQNIPTSKLEVALKPICAAFDPWLRLCNQEHSTAAIASGTPWNFNFKQYFGGDLNASMSTSFSLPMIASSNAMNAHDSDGKIVSSSTTSLSLARAISNVFADDVISNQLIRFLTLGGCSISSINAQIAAFQLKLDHTTNDDAQLNFLSNFDEVVQLALNDSPGVASAVCALNTSNVIDVLMKVLTSSMSSSLTLKWNTIHDRLKEYFLDDLLALVNVWKDDKLMYPVAILSKFAITFIDFDIESQNEIKQTYHQLFTLSSECLGQDSTAMNLLSYA